MQSNGSDRGLENNGAASATSSVTLVEQLRHENAELRRDLAAQTSMLTSRNKERERLYQDVEDLKLGQRRGNGSRSVAGDSIFERSASRAHGRSSSRASDGTRVTQLSDAERDGYEAKNGELRDQISELKLKNQELTRALKECQVELDQADVAKAEFEALIRSYDEDLVAATQDLQTLQADREETIKRCEELEAGFQDLKAEAQESIDALEDELEQKGGELQAMEVELQNHKENFNALQNEMRSMNEGLLRIEEDAQQNMKKVQDLQLELGDTNRDLESVEHRLFEANSKAERLTVQQQSSQSEIAFLREEQDGDKIKIGDLESALKAVHTTLQDAKERVKELEKRLADERHQREVVDSKEKQEVQKVINDLNREASGAKDEAKKLKKSLQSREQEATSWKERLMELENSLREALGDLNGTRSSLLKVRSHILYIA